MRLIKNFLSSKVVFMFVMLLLYSSLIFGCIEDKKSNNLTYWEAFETVFYKDYPEYYHNHVKYEFGRNAKIVDSQIYFEKIEKDSMNLFQLYKINSKVPDFRDEIIMKIIKRRVGGDESYIFYKYDDNYVGTNGNCLLNIEYPIDYSSRRKMKILAMYGLEQEHPYRAAFVQWSSKPTNRRVSYYDSTAPPVYMWGINKTTDTIWTNFSEESIKKLYPEFEGVYIFKKYDKVEIDYSYSTDDVEFFENIKFIE